MKLTGNDIKALVNECVMRVLEARGTLNDKLEGLARLIIDRIKSGENEFVIGREELEQYYPYEHVPESLNVAVKNMYSQYTGNKASYSITTNTVNIDSMFVLFMRDGRYAKEYEPYVLELLMHELTHLVNHQESQEDVDKIPRPMKFERTDSSKTAKNILYLFDKGEMNARVSEFKWALKGAWTKDRDGKHKDLSAYDKITRLQAMRRMIDKVQNDTQPSDDEPLSIVELLLQSRGYKKTQMDGRERMLNPTARDFERAKEAIVKKLTKAYDNYFTKITKVYYDETN